MAAVPMIAAMDNMPWPPTPASMKSFFICIKFSRKDAKTQSYFFIHIPLCQSCLFMDDSYVIYLLNSNPNN